MRTRPIGGLAALIAVLAMVALAGPAQTRTPGTAAGTGQVAFTPLVLERFRTTSATATAPATRDLAAEVAAPVLVESGAASVPARPRLATVPGVRAVAVHKAVPRAVAARRQRATTTAASAGVSGGGSWHVAAYSWYGPGLYGHGTACGETLTRSLLGVANLTLPCGTRVTLRNPSNGRSITVRVVDRGPYVSGRMWDLTSATCGALGACYTGRIQYRVP